MGTVGPGRVGAIVGIGAGGALVVAIAVVIRVDVAVLVVTAVVVVELVAWLALDGADDDPERTGGSFETEPIRR